MSENHELPLEASLTAIWDQAAEKADDNLPQEEFQKEVEARIRFNSALRCQTSRRDLLLEESLSCILMLKETATQMQVLCSLLPLLPISCYCIWVCHSEVIHRPNLWREVVFSWLKRTPSSSRPAIIHEINLYLQEDLCEEASTPLKQILGIYSSARRIGCHRMYYPIRIRISEVNTQ